jgi:hypothetical protein
MSAKPAIAWGSIVYVVLSCGIGAFAGYFGQPLVHTSDRAVNVIVTLFSVLAGFLVAIVTLIGDPTIYTGRTWRVQELALDRIRKRLDRQKVLFFIYLLTLGLVFLSTLIPKQFTVAVFWSERAYLAIAVLAFMLSLRLPGALMKIQMERHGAMIEAKKNSGKSANAE